MAIRNGNGNTNFLFGTFGSDEINGRGGNDFLFGWFGNDILRGGNGNDWLFGGSGSDRLFGGNGDDIGFGGSGNDRLVGGRGSDQMYGGSGNDTFVYRAERNVGEVDYYAGGSGNDRLVLRLNADEAADTDIQADIAAFEAFIAAGGGGNFTFDSLGLTVNSIERLTVRAPEPVEPTNTAPVVSGAVTLAASDENTVRAISFSDLLAGASDADSDDLSVSGIIVTSGNAIFVGGDAGIDVTPDTDDETEVTLSYTISDGNGGSVAQTASFDLLRVNEAPTIDVAVDLGTVVEDNAITVTEAQLLAGAQDADDDMLSVTGVSVPSGAATVTGNAADGFTITPAANFSGSLVVEYSIEDGQGGSVEQTADLFVSFENDAPEAPDVNLTVGEDGSLSFLVSDYALDVDGDLLVTGIAESNTTGQLQINGGTATYTPGSAFQDLAPGEQRDDTFVYTVDDGIVTSTGTVTVTVEGANDDPTVGDLIDLGEVDENTTRKVTFAELLAGANDVDGGLLSVSGMVVTSENAEFDVTDDGYLITPLADDESAVELSFVIDDGQGGSVGQTAVLDLLPVITNSDPDITRPLDLGPFDEDTSLFVTSEQLTSNIADADDDPLTISAAGVSVIAGDATVTEENNGYRITPAADFNTDPGFINLTLAYTVEDGNGGSVATTANVNVTGVQDAPTVQDVNLTVNEDDSISFRPGDFAFDPDGEPISVSVDDAQAAGQVELVINNGIAEIIYTPGPALQGLDENVVDFLDFFEFSFSDGLATTTAGVEVLVQGQNDAPVVTDIAETINESETVTFDLDDFASDVDDPNTLTFAVIPGMDTAGEVTFNSATNEVTYTPGRAFEALNDGESAQDMFFFTASDGIETTEGEVTITVNGESEPNSAPVALDDPEGFGDFPPIFQAITFFGDFFDVLRNDFDPDGDTLQIISVSLPGGDDVLLGPEGTTVSVGGVSVELINGELGQALYIRPEDQTDRFVDLEYTITDGQAEATATLSFFVDDNMEV